jgi:nucleotide-binding universal stress UspA family protein
LTEVTGPDGDCERIARHAASSAVATGNSERRSTVSSHARRPILIGFDNSEGARHAIAIAASLFHEREAIVLHVWSPIAVISAAYGGAVALSDYDDDALRDAATKVAAAGCAAAAEVGLQARPEVAEVTYKGAWHTILEAAREHNAELVVLGSRGLSTFKSLMLGSVSHGVAQHAHLPVLIVPPAESAAATG